MPLKPTTTLNYLLSRNLYKALSIVLALEMNAS